MILGKFERERLATIRSVKNRFPSRLWEYRRVMKNILLLIPIPRAKMACLSWNYLILMLLTGVNESGGCMYIITLLSD